MFIKATATALTVLLLTSSAFAQSVSQGDAQLAANAGVQPGLYTTNQLIQLIDAQREGDQQTVDFILSQPGGDVTRSGNFSSDAAVGPGWDMMARLNGVEPGTLSANELILLDAERISDN